MKSRLAAGLFILAGFALAAQSARIAPPAPTLGALKGPSGIALVGLFEDPPLLSSGQNLKTVAVPSADMMAAKVISGEYAVSVLPVNLAAKLRASGIPIALGAVIGNGMLSLLTNDPDIDSLADLRGKELNVAGQGATPEFLIRRLLRDAGLDPVKDLHLAFALPYPEMAMALAGGKIAYALLPEPFVTLARIAKPELRRAVDIRALWQKSTGMSDYPMTVLVFRTDGSVEEGDVRRILDAARASIDMVISDNRKAASLVEKNDLGLNAAVAAAAIPRSNYVFQSPRDARAAIESLLRAFMEVSPASIGGRLPDDSFYTTF
jgi:NitT/TauT family transport system substrate-binding protein